MFVCHWERKPQYPDKWFKGFIAQIYICNTIYPTQLQTNLQLLHFWFVRLARQIRPNSSHFATNYSGTVLPFNHTTKLSLVFKTSKAPSNTTTPLREPRIPACTSYGQIFLISICAFPICVSATSHMAWSHLALSELVVLVGWEFFCARWGASCGHVHRQPQHLLTSTHNENVLLMHRHFTATAFARQCCWCSQPGRIMQDIPQPCNVSRSI